MATRWIQTGEQHSDRDSSRHYGSLWQWTAGSRQDSGRASSDGALCSSRGFVRRLLAAAERVGSRDRSTTRELEISTRSTATGAVGLGLLGTVG